MAGERTEAPTQRRKDDARKRGQSGKSQELVSVGVLLAAVIGMRVLAPALWDDLGNIMREGLGHPSQGELTPQDALAMGRDTGTRMLLAMAPLFAVLAIAGVALSVGQTGLVLSSAHLKPKLSHVNPGAGFKRIVSVEGLMNLAKAMAKMGVVAVVVWMTMRGQLDSIAVMGQDTPGQGVAHMGMLGFDIAIRAASVLFVLALADWAWQRRRFLKQLRMTKEEVRQESRETDGDPQIKGAIRRRRQALMNRMIAAVPQADVVVTNPTHYAVALKYDPVSMAAPMVVAKGERLLAQRIKEVARKHNVPVLEEPPLARALFAAVPVGQFVPANLFRAVAEVLAWVYALRSKTSFRGAQARPQEAR